MRMTVVRLARIALVATVSLCGSVGWCETPATSPAATAKPPYVPSCITQDNIAKALAPALRDEARPVVIWSDPKWKGAPVVWPLTFTSLGWRTELTALPPALGPIRIRETDVYTEVILASEEREAALRSAFGTTHPSGFISAPDRRSLVQSFFGLLGSEVRIAGDLDAQGPYTDEEKYAPLFDGLESSSLFREAVNGPRACLELNDHRSVNETILNLGLKVRATIILANGVYTATPFSAIPYTEQDARGLLAILGGKHSYDEKNAAVLRLQAFGKEALPLLLAEYSSSADDRHDRLAEALAGIPSPERDRLFINELHRFDPSKNTMEGRSLRTTLIKALGKSNSPEAVTELRRFASNAKGDLQREAQVALNLLGASTPARSIDTLVEVDPAIQQALDATDAATSRDAAYAVIDQVFLPSGPRLLMKSVKPNQAGGHDFSGRLSGKGGWDIQVGARQGELIPVSMRYVRGGLDGAGFAAVLRKVDGRWLVVWYRMLWIS